jgi:hypothetical protein
MIFQGLRKYQFMAESKELARRLLEMAVMKNPQLREYYNAETGEGIGQTQFWGFTALYYGMLLEWFTGVDASALEGPYRAIMPEDLGVGFGG